MARPVLRTGALTTRRGRGRACPPTQSAVRSRGTRPGWCTRVARREQQQRGRPPASLISCSACCRGLRRSSLPITASSGQRSLARPAMVSSPALTRPFQVRRLGRTRKRLMVRLGSCPVPANVKGPASAMKAGSPVAAGDPRCVVPPGSPQTPIRPQGPGRLGDQVVDDRPPGTSQSRGGRFVLGSPGRGRPR